MDIHVSGLVDTEGSVVTDCRKGTHISFFTPMRGEDNALLPWLFKQKIILMLVDQSEHGQHIAKLFQPATVDLTHVAFESYLRLSLHTEMKVATGFPEFVPSSVLEDPSYSRRQNKVHVA